MLLRLSRSLAGTLVVLLAGPSLAQAQGGRDSVTRAARDSAGRPVVPRPASAAQRLADSLRPPVSPGRAFLTSLFVPGLGQSRLQRPLPGAIYASVEALSVVMLLKAQSDLRIAQSRADDAIINRYTVSATTGEPVVNDDGVFVPLDTVANEFGAERVLARRAQVEDWIAVLIANHLFAGADAFVASLLWDLPVRVGVQRLRSGIGLGLNVRW